MLCKCEECLNKKDTQLEQPEPEQLATPLINQKKRKLGRSSQKYIQSKSKKQNELPRIKQNLKEIMRATQANEKNGKKLSPL